MFEKIHLVMKSREGDQLGPTASSLTSGENSEQEAMEAKKRCYSL